MDRMRADVRVLFEDAYLIVAIKPYGVLSEAHDALPNMPAILSGQCGCAVYPVHRLDITTEGLTAYAKTPASAAALSDAIRQGLFEKTYLALVEGIPDERGTLTDLLYYDRSRNKSYVVKRARRGVKEASLTYERLSSGALDGTPVSLLKIRLLTGRTHQIRVQFASRRHPLVGDRRYGSRVPSENIALCAAELRFPHPVTGEQMRFDCAPSLTVMK